MSEKTVAELKAAFVGGKVPTGDDYVNVFDSFPQVSTLTDYSRSPKFADVYAKGPLVDVRAYGAVGDGTTDDYTALTAAYAATPAGGSVYLPPGYTFVTGCPNRYGATATYYAFTPRSGIRWVGGGCLKLKSGETGAGDGSRNPNLFFAVDAALSDIEFRDIEIDMNAAGNPLPSGYGSPIVGNGFFYVYGSASGGAAFACNRIRFKNLYVHDHSGSNTIYVGQQKADGPLGDDIEVSGCRFRNVGQATGDHSTINTFATNVRVVGNSFINDSSHDYPRNYGAPFESHGSNSMFNDNIVQTYYKGVMFSQNYKEDAWNNSAIGNTLIDIGYVAFELNAIVPESSGCHSVHNTVISGNTITFSEDADHTNIPWRAGLNLIVASECRGVIFANNIVRRIQEVSDVIRYMGVYMPPGTDYKDTGKVRGIQIIGNQFESLGPGIFLNLSASSICHPVDWVIRSNLFKNAYDIAGGDSWGIYMTSIAGYPVSAVIEENTFLSDQTVNSFGTGIELGDYFTNAVVRNNSFLNMKTNKFKFGAGLIGHSTSHIFDADYYHTRGTTASAATGQVVAHGLPSTPTNIKVTSTGADPGSVWVSSVGATAFTINFSSGGNRAFYWEADYRP